jgi:DNA damage-binding protein 1
MSADLIQGRILVFGVTEDRQLKVMIQQSLRGACRCLGVIENNAGSWVVAGLIKTVSHPSSRSPEKRGC